MGKCSIGLKSAEKGSEGNARVEARGIKVMRFKKSRVVRIRNEEWEEKRFREKRSLKCCHSLSSSLSPFPLCFEEEQDARNLIQSNWRRRTCGFVSQF